MTETETKTSTIIPAGPGWYVAALIEGESCEYESQLSLNPIIAWEIQRTEGPYHPSVGRPRSERCIDHHVLPLTTNGNMEHIGNLWAIKRPDGKFETVRASVRRHAA
jgi:hypothetical protein